MNLVFFDNSYMDASFSARLHRQMRQIARIFYLTLPDILCEKYMVTGSVAKRFTIKKIMVVAFLFLRSIAKGINRDQRVNSHSSWRDDAIYHTSISSFDREINEKGGIVDNMGAVHTTAQSYKNHLKDNDLVIKDWSPGSNKNKEREFKGCDDRDIARGLESLGW